MQRVTHAPTYLKIWNGGHVLGYFMHNTIFVIRNYGKTSRFDHLSYNNIQQKLINNGKVQICIHIYIAYNPRSANAKNILFLTADIAYQWIFKLFYYLNYVWYIKSCWKPRLLKDITMQFNKRALYIKTNSTLA